MIALAIALYILGILPTFIMLDDDDVQYSRPRLVAALVLWPLIAAFILVSFFTQTALWRLMKARARKGGGS